MVKTPNDAASAHPTGASPRTSRRTRQASSTKNSADTSHAARIEGAVSRPSNEWVIARIGIRRIEGYRPK